MHMTCTWPCECFEDESSPTLIKKYRMAHCVLAQAERKERTNIHVINLGERKLKKANKQIKNKTKVKQKMNLPFLESKGCMSQLIHANLQVKKAILDDQQ